MIYVALLRGINVGGNNKINMQQLKQVFLNAGMQNVTTYINSGNVIFSNYELTPSELVTTLETAIQETFMVQARVLLRDMANITSLVNVLPINWKNDTTMKCDVMFLWDTVDMTSAIDALHIDYKIEDVTYTSGAVSWRIDRSNISKSKIPKIIGTPLYKNMTIRNCNSVRAILKIMLSIDE